MSRESEEPGREDHPAPMFIEQSFVTKPAWRWIEQWLAPRGALAIYDKDPNVTPPQPR